MKYIWQFTIDDYMNIYNLAVKMGIKPGQSMEPAILQYANDKNLKPVGATELNKEELLAEHASHGANILDIAVDEKGNSTYSIIKKKEQTKEETDD